MGPKPTPSKQSTLFSFFSKSPKTSTVNSNNHQVLSPKRSPNRSKESSTQNEGKTPLKDPGSDYAVGDLLWSKMESFPWWPGLVCNHPTENTHYKGGKVPKVHVQFFDDPVSRAWIKAKNVRPYEGSECQDCERGGMFYSLCSPVQKGMEQADRALKLARDDRLALVVDLQPSSDDDDDEEGMDLDLDPSIFDAEMSDEDNGKENLVNDSDAKVTPKKTPSKSPGKHGRPQRSKTKRRKIVVEDSDPDDSADEFKPDKSGGSGDDDEGSSGVDENDVTSDSASEADSPVKLPVKRKRKETKPLWGPKTARKPIEKERESSPPAMKKPVNNIASGDATSGAESPRVSTATKSKLAAFTAADTVGLAGDAEEKTDYQHTKYEWLRPDKIRDGEKKLRSDPNYNPRTLYIPDQDKCKFTPAMRQWWEIKSQHFDTVLFFKMGKFYELFHMDAAIAVSELGLIYMKGDYAHSGFPEIAYGRYADTLVKKGYKVARIEQTETPDMMEKRCKNMSKAPTKYDKVVKREVCRIQTKGTKTFSFLAGECGDSQSTYLLAMAEKESDQDGCSVYGVCFVDTSIGKFHIGQFTDDRHCSRLRTLIAHYPPVQILHERGKLTARTLQLISANLSSVMKEALAPRTEFWESGKTLRVLAEESYFKEEGNDDVVWPDVLKTMLSDSDTLGRSAAEEYTIAVSSLGALTWYLRYCLLDEELLSMRNFDLYKPLDAQKAEVSSMKATTTPDLVNKHMVLDGVTLSNLDVTENSSTGTLEGSLLEQLDQCHTPFGKRLLRQWICAPLCNQTSINDRLDAIGDLHSAQDVVATVTEILKKLPDLERLLSRIHTLGTAKSSRHPDTRAILYEEVQYSKRKIEDFLATLGGFKEAVKISKKFKEVAGGFKSKLLRRTVRVEGTAGGGYFPDLQEELAFFDHAFDHNKAKKDGVIVPSQGVDEDYDQAVDDMKSTTRALDQYLDRQKTKLSCRSIVYWGTGKNRYQMEIPDSAGKKVPNEYELMSSKKGVKRYRTTDIEDLLAKMTEAEERKDTALKGVMRRIFHNFDKRYKQWDMTVQCLSVLDVLMSLAQYSRCAEGAICRPEIVSPDEGTKPFMEIREARHPCVCRTFTGGDFIPNDTVIGIADENDMDTDEASPATSDSRVVLVTGPNMGGKSTLMRQVGLITIIAQMGCYVPAEKCRLTPVDRVFTRLGASDRIMAGESTFFVELSETSAILQHSTQHSLVLVDELGRGTATYDGTAIACAVVEELSRNLQCRTLFSTHYHSLVEEFSRDSNIRLGHMACMVENDDSDDPSQETITFLYKFTHGACPKSYGFNAARLANLPEDVIKVAVHKAKEFEQTQDRIRRFKGLWNDSSPQSISSLQQCVPV